MYFNTIYVIESLPSNEWKTGSDLYRDVIEPEVSKRRDIFSIFIQVHDKADFFEALEWIIKNSWNNARGPLLHIECHGAKNGLTLASDDFVSWKELKPFLIRLNVQCRLNLLVVLAACKGAYVLNTIDLTDCAPVWGLIGPKDDVWNVELFEDLSAFYSEIIASQNGRLSLERLNGQPLGPNSRYLFTPVEMSFRRIYKLYLETQTTKRALRRRENSIVKMITRKKRIGPGQERLIRSSLKQELRNHEKRFAEHKMKFFFIDLIPENESRFLISFADLKVLH